MSQSLGGSEPEARLSGTSHLLMLMGSLVAVTPESFLGLLSGRQ